MATPSAGSVQLEVDKQHSSTPGRSSGQTRRTPPAQTATAAAPAVSIDSILPALSDRRGTTSSTTPSKVAPKPAPPIASTPTITASRPTRQPPTDQTLAPATRPIQQSAAGNMQKPAMRSAEQSTEAQTQAIVNRLSTPGSAGNKTTTSTTTGPPTPKQTPHNHTQKRVSLPSEAVNGRPNGLGGAKSTSSLFKDVIVTGKTRPPATNGAATPIRTPHTLPTPPVSTTSAATIPAALPARPPTNGVTSLSPKPPTAAIPSPDQTVDISPASSIKTEPSTRTSSLLSSTPGSTGQSAPRPAYKMKRTGRPSVLSPTALHMNGGSRTPTPLGTSNHTPTGKWSTPFKDTFAIKTQPPQQPPSRLAQTSPKLASIESDILPRATISPPRLNRPPQPSPAAVISNGQVNGTKRRMESVVDLTQSAQKRAKPTTSLDTSDNAVKEPAVLTISLSSGPEDSPDEEEDSSDSSGSDIEDIGNTVNPVIVTDDEEEGEEEEEEEEEYDEEEDDDDDDEVDDNDNGSPINNDETLSDAGFVPDEEDPNITDDVRDEEAAAISTSDAPVTLYSTPSGKPYNKFIDENGDQHGTFGALIPDGYKKWSDRVTPWICPIRSCRRLFPELISMGGHFSKAHRATNFNDNLDGTLSEVIRLKQSSERHGARVISQKASSDVERLAEPRVPEAIRRLVASKANLLAKKDSLRKRAKERGRQLATLMHEKASGRRGKSQVPRKELLVSPSGREYATTMDGDIAYGALLPDGYKLSTTDPSLPWVCPVRDCQNLLQAVKNLGGHFTRKHRETLFNDNGDGTLSKVGKHGMMRPIIVSAIKRSPDELEPLAPQRRAGDRTSSAALQYPVQNGQAKKAQPVQFVKSVQSKKNGDAAATRERDDLPAPGKDDFAKPLPVNRQATWEYIQPFLAHALRRPVLPTTGYSKLFLEAPRVRGLKWNEQRQNAARDGVLGSMSVAAVLIQISGDFVPEPCDHCKSGQGLFEGCVITSSKGNADMNVAFSKCANCVERKKNIPCSLQHIFRPRFAKLFPDLNYDTAYRYARSGHFGQWTAQMRLLATMGDFARRERRTPKSKHDRDGAVVNADGDGDDSSVLILNGASSHRGERSGERNGEGEAGSPASSDNEPLAARGGSRRDQTDTHRDYGFPSLREALHQRRSRRITDKDSLTPQPQAPAAPKRILSASTTTALALSRTTTTTSSRGANGHHNSALMSAGNVAQLGPEALEMEDWEVAPGRVQTQSSNENIAFSNAYLTSKQMVQIDHNVSYRVEVVRPGQTVSFEADGNATRICMLAAGKLRVAVGEDRFVMGPNGMFKVKPGMAFAVENRLYVDSYLHISALQNMA